MQMENTPALSTDAIGIEVLHCIHTSCGTLTAKTCFFNKHLSDFTPRSIRDWLAGRNGAQRGCSFLLQNSEHRCQEAAAALGRQLCIQWYVAQENADHADASIGKKSCDGLLQGISFNRAIYRRAGAVLNQSWFDDYFKYNGSHCWVTFHPMARSCSELRKYFHNTKVEMGQSVSGGKVLRELLAPYTWYRTRVVNGYPSLNLCIKHSLNTHDWSAIPERSISWYNRPKSRTEISESECKARDFTIISSLH
jgi:hypothetical protein